MWNELSINNVEQWATANQKGWYHKIRGKGDPVGQSDMWQAWREELDLGLGAGVIFGIIGKTGQWKLWSKDKEMNGEEPILFGEQGEEFSY